MEGKKANWATTCFMISAGTTIAYTIPPKNPPICLDHRLVTTADTLPTHIQTPPSETATHT